MKCEALPPKLEGESIEKLKVIITKNVSAVVGVQVKNFGHTAGRIDLVKRICTAL